MEKVTNKMNIAISKFNKFDKLITFIGMKAFNISQSNVKPSFTPLILSILVAPIFLDPKDLGHPFKNFEITNQMELIQKDSILKLNIVQDL